MILPRMAVLLNLTPHKCEVKSMYEAEGRQVRTEGVPCASYMYLQ